MSKKNQHVVPSGKDWAVKGEGNDRKTAINQKSEVVIHRPDGTIRDKDSYGKDPNPPKDKKH